MEPKRSKWTREEKDFLIENWGVLSIPKIANKLNRTENAVYIQKNKLKLGPFIDNGDYISASQLFKALGYPKDTLKKSIWKDNKFPIIMKQVKNRKIRCVKLKSFWVWAEKNQNLLDFSGYDQYSLGKEPKWVNEKRIKDRQKQKYVRRRWTQREDEYLIFLVNEFKYTYKELFEKINRTEDAIERRLADLNVSARPLTITKKEWTKEEIDSLKDYILTGYDYNYISDKLSRGVGSIKSKTYRICNTKNLNKAKEVLKERR